MKTLQTYNTQIQQMAGTQMFVADEVYKESPYIIKEYTAGKTAIFNCFTREAVLMGNEEYTKNYSAENVFFVNRWYFIPDRWDAQTWFESFEKMQRSARKKKALVGLNEYVILPTLGCNARCPYCFQCDEKKTSMSEETADAVVEFIRRTHSGRAYLRWFGGEPLINAPIISRISKELSDSGTNYVSSITTNGLLLNQIDIAEMQSLWKLRHAQITLDGTADYYNSIKRWKNPVGDEFERVINNIKILATNGISVIVRMNVSLNNESELLSLLDAFHERFSGYGNVTLYPHILFEGLGENPIAYTNIDNTKLYSICKAVWGKISEYGLNELTSYPAMNLSNCMGDSLSSVCISPNGSLTTCEHFSDDKQHIIGNVFDGITDYAEAWRWQTKYHCDDCVNCRIRPLCTKLKQCPVEGNCNPAEVDFKEWQIRQFLRKQIERS